MTPRLLRDPAVLLATCGGIGFVGVAPGTFGAAAGLVIGLATAALGPLGESLVAAGLCLAGIPICTRAAAVLGGHDPGTVVLDEVAAMPLVLLAVPAPDRSPLVLLAAFGLFRLFDITKPFPCRRLERLPAGLGIMADDWAAAGWAAACLVVARRLGWV
jgi:phosphatidylglycerophosphatase A